jgi:stage III sporulation protein SpoIIIAA
MRDRQDLNNDIDLLLAALPPHIEQAIRSMPNDPADLLEIILDLGRLPEARYRGQESFLSSSEVRWEDLEYVTDRIGEFGEDNRAGIPRTLHRISAIRNRRGMVIGLTCRFGRAVFGTVAIIRDLVETGQSILLLGKPGTGKTTLLRETARVLAEELRKRVVIVDTSNEIAGDGDIPHPGIGRARRMHVPRPAEQHAVMIEAVENHMPEVIVIDEIGTELEAMAARTIAERGVQLVGTAHGNTLDNLMVNPTLSDLVGGIQAVTLGDEEARRRGTQKTVLERKAPPSFDVLVEIKSWDEMIVYADVAAAVDAILRGEEPEAELRYKDAEGNIKQTVPEPAQASDLLPSVRRERSRPGTASPRREKAAAGTPDTLVPAQRIFPFGVSRNRLESAIQRLHVPALIVRDMHDATLVMTLKNYYRQSAQRLKQAEDQGVPVYVLRNNTITQMERQLAHIFQLNGFSDEPGGSGDGDDPVEDAMLEAETAISQVMNGERSTVELAPRSSYIRRLQHQMADRYNLRSESRGADPNRRVKISRS